MKKENNRSIADVPVRRTSRPSTSVDHTERQASSAYGREHEYTERTIDHSAVPQGSRRASSTAPRPRTTHSAAPTAVRRSSSSASQQPHAATRNTVIAPRRSSVPMAVRPLPHRSSANRRHVFIYTAILVILGLAVIVIGWRSIVKPVASPEKQSSELVSDVGVPVNESVSSLDSFSPETSSADDTPSAEDIDIAAYLNAHPDKNTSSLLKQLEVNPDCYNFVANYPEKYGTVLDCTLTADDLIIEEDRLLPLFMQWDDRWGYSDYGGYVFGTNACGPTTLSMVLVGLTGDASYNPRVVADFAEEHGYASVGGNGSEWIIMSQGGTLLGLTVEEISPTESWVRSEISQGHPVVCIMGPGHFTTGGHYIVICGLDDDKFLINDCNSITRSQQSWNFNDFKDEIRNLWAFSYDSESASN